MYVYTSVIPLKKILDMPLNALLTALYYDHGFASRLE